MIPLAYCFLLFSVVMPYQCTYAADHIEKYNLRRLQENPNQPIPQSQRIGASTDVFVDYIKKHPGFSDSDEGVLPDTLRKLREEDYDLYESISHSAIAEWQRSSSAATPSSASMFSSSLPEGTPLPYGIVTPTPNNSPRESVHKQHNHYLDLILLQRLKNEQEARMEVLSIKHENEMQKRTMAQNKFYVTTLVSVISTLIALIEAAILIKKE